ncbi:hypothetical protein D3C73_1020110 [compost metagenome]
MACPEVIVPVVTPKLILLRLLDRMILALQILNRVAISKGLHINGIGLALQRMWFARLFHGFGPRYIFHPCDWQ